MGIIAVALGFGGVLGLYGALLHTLNHAIAKAVLFLSSGDVVARATGPREAAEVRGLLAAVPVTGGALLLGSFAVARVAAVRPVPVRADHRRAGFASASPVFPLLLLALLAAGVHRVRPDHDRHGDRATRRDRLASPYHGRWSYRGRAVTAAPPRAVGPGGAAGAGPVDPGRA